MGDHDGVARAFKVREVLKLHGNSFTGHAEALFCDAAGQACMTAAGASTKARRMKAELPQTP
jgi:hypothetical protein